MSVTARNGLHIPEGTQYGITFYTDIGLDMAKIDAVIALGQQNAATDPTTNDNAGDGYAVGSWWFNTTAHKVYVCIACSVSAATWWQVYPAACGDLTGTITNTQLAGSISNDKLAGSISSDKLADTYIKAAGTVGLSAAWDAGSFEIRALTFQSDIATGTAPFTVASATKVTNLNAATVNGFEDTAFLKHSLATAESDFVVASGNGAFVKKTLAETKTILGVGAAGGAAFWTVMPGSPDYSNTTTFTIADASNANNYEKAFTKGTTLRWKAAAAGHADQFAIVNTAVYGANVVTITILGNVLDDNFTDMKYCIHKALREVFIVPGTMPGSTATADIAKTTFAPYDMYMFSCLVRYKTAATTTGATWDIFSDPPGAGANASLFAIKPPIAAAATVGTDTVSICFSATSGTATDLILRDSILTLSYLSGHATTPGADAYVSYWYMPVSWRYLT